MGSLDCFDFHFSDFLKRETERQKVMLSRCGYGKDLTGFEKLGKLGEGKHAQNILSERNLIKMYEKNFPTREE